MRLIESTQWINYKNHNTLFVKGYDVLVDTQSLSPIMPLSHGLGHKQITVHDVHVDHDMVFARASYSDYECKNTHWVSAKKLLNHANDQVVHHVLRGVHYLGWDARHQFCSQCGARLEKQKDLFEKKCVQCERLFYPNLAPAIAVAIRRGDSIVLARGPYFPKGQYSVLAGFVDPGESAEAAVHREVKEEVGLEVTNIQYVGTQSWPFPGSFMIAFTADYAGGEICVDGVEIEDAQWFELSDLPDLPVRGSLSRRLIEGL